LSLFRLPHFPSALILLTASLVAGTAWADALTRSTSIALSRDGSLLFNVNHEANSVTVFAVRKGLRKLEEVPVGRGPVCVAASRNRAFVTNGASGSVSVLKEEDDHFKVVAEIPVGAEPRGCALTPDGERLYVANHTAGTSSVIDTDEMKVVETVQVGGNPFAIAIVKDTVFVTQLYARLIDDGDDNRESFDDEKEGVVQAFKLNDPGSLKEITLSPLADTGFTASRAKFCQQLNPAAVNNTFCPDTSITDPNDPVIAKDPQAAFPNQLSSVLARPTTWCDSRPATSRPVSSCVATRPL
jgi:YVTN family beta-propeller protein